MTETQNPEARTRNEAALLRSLGRLARGLSALFWGLPASLVICAETARADWLRPLGVVPTLAGTGLLLYGLRQMGDFQKQERPWRHALDRAKLLGLVNFGLCPFLYWQNKMPEQPFFNAAVAVLALSALLFLFNLNVVLKQLGAMLPDETLRHETRLFTLLNCWLLFAILLLGIAYVVLLHQPRLPPALGALFVQFQSIGFWALTFFALLPLAMTMALLWKAKEVILDSVFGPRH
ncbi:MAG: hypothetical protein ACLQAH_15925 [Limisphaerales bacterium]